MAHLRSCSARVRKGGEKMEPALNEYQSPINRATILDLMDVEAIPQEWGPGLSALLTSTLQILLVSTQPCKPQTPKQKD